MGQQSGLEKEKRGWTANASLISLPASRCTSAASAYLSRISRRALKDDIDSCCAPHIDQARYGAMKEAICTRRPVIGDATFTYKSSSFLQTGLNNRVDA